MAACLTPMVLGATSESTGQPVVIDAESGTLGFDFNHHEENGVGYVTIVTNFESGAPGGPNRVISFEVQFDSPGTYDLFARVRVGPDATSDDSFLYGNGFGPKGSTVDVNEWIVADDLTSAGFTRPVNVVSDKGRAANGVWKWVNLSENNFGEAPATFIVNANNLTTVFEIGGREDGFDIDKFAFGRSDLFYTVQNLDNGEEGSIVRPAVPPLADGHSRFLGNIYSSSQLGGYLEYWNQVTPENAGTWGSVEQSRNMMDWGPLDAAYRLAKDNGLAFRFHTLIWGDQQPSWIELMDPATQLAEIEEWFSAVAQRYPDIDYVEVVNEALHHPPNQSGNGGGNYMEALGGTGVTGWDWVVSAFRLARTHFPGAKLMINDYNILNSITNARTYVEIVELLQAESLVDGIGIQGHAFTTRGASESLITSILDMLAATGLPVQVTELDIDGQTDELQLQEYQRIIPTLWEHSTVEGITLWGWKPGMLRTEQEAFLVRADGSERPALGWLCNYLMSQPVAIDDVEVFDTVSIISNYPNPFTASTRIVYNVADAARVALDVFDILGRRVRRVVDDVQSPGRHSVTFEARGLPSGIYISRIRAGSTMRIAPMTLVR